MAPDSAAQVPVAREYVIVIEAPVICPVNVISLLHGGGVIITTNVMAPDEDTTAPEKLEMP